MFVTVSYDNHIFVCIYTSFTFKATDAHTNNVKLLCYVAKTLLRPANHPNSEDNVCISAITALAAQCTALKC